MPPPDDDTKYLFEKVKPSDVNCPQHGSDDCFFFVGYPYCKKRLDVIGEGEQRIEYSSFTGRFFCAQYTANGCLIKKLGFYPGLVRAQRTWPNAILGSTIALKP